MLPTFGSLASDKKNMADTSPRNNGCSTECYAAVREGGHGLISGRLHHRVLHDLRNPWVRRTLERGSDQVVASFGTREELERWLAAVPEQRRKVVT